MNPIELTKSILVILCREILRNFCTAITVHIFFFFFAKKKKAVILHIKFENLTSREKSKNTSLIVLQIVLVLTEVSNTV